MQTQNNTHPIAAKIKERFTFLTDAEIAAFVDAHSWLKDVKNPNTLFEYVHEHFEGLAVRYNYIMQSLKKMKAASENGAQQEKPQAINQANNNKQNEDFVQGLENIQKEKEKEKNSQQNANNDYNPSNIIIGQPVANNNQDSFSAFLEYVQGLYRDIYEVRHDHQLFFTIIDFINNTITQMLKAPKEQGLRHIGFTNPQLQEHNLILILGLLGFEILVSSETEMVFNSISQPAPEFLGIVSDSLASMYFQNPEFMREFGGVPPVSNQRPYQQPMQMENYPGQNQNREFLASRHEQRLNQKNFHPSSVNSTNNSSNNSSNNNNVNYVSPPVNPVVNNPPMAGQYVHQGQPINMAPVNYFNGGNMQNVPMNPDQVRNKIYNTNNYLSDPFDAPKQQYDYQQDANSKASEKKPKQMTLADLKNRERDDDQKVRGPGKSNLSDANPLQVVFNNKTEEDKVAFGLRALEYTNQFRATQGLPPVAWSQNLCDIGMEHSKNMAECKVPFGHDGFEARSKKTNFFHQSMSENVAFNNGAFNPAKTAVDGWINSPGHRKNMLSTANVCGIACYKAVNGAWYFTQLFAWRT